jgi:hypothetical protein
MPALESGLSYAPHNNLLYGSSAAERRMLNGSCACGRVRYEIRGELIGPITYCHCWRCRKHSGSSFGTTVGVRTEDFVIVEGEDQIANWESSPGIRRYFAGCCGSPIFKKPDDEPGLIGFRLGTLDSDPMRTADVHYLVDSKAPWVELNDSLPQESGGVAFGERD